MNEFFSQMLGSVTAPFMMWHPLSNAVLNSLHSHCYDISSLTFFQTDILAGTTSLKHLEENLAARNITLSDAEVQQISDIFEPSKVLGERYAHMAATFHGNIWMACGVNDGWWLLLSDCAHLILIISLLKCDIQRDETKSSLYALRIS